MTLVLSCLVKNGADVNGHASEKWKYLTPVMLAIKNGQPNAAVFLIQHGADVNVEDIDGKTALHYAVQRYVGSHQSEWCEVFSCLIKNGADVNIEDSDGKTAFHHAVQHYNSSHHSEWCEVFSCLIKNGADINARAKDNYTPLMLAITSCHLSAVIFLTEHGADVDIQNRDGKTALHFAVQRYHSSHHSEWCEVLRCLVENGADINARENNDNTPLMIASFCGHVNVVTFLIQHGAELDVQNDRGNTALHFAVQHNFSGIVHILLDHGATHLYNNQKLTPLLFASNNSLTAIVEELTRRPEFTKEQRVDALELLGASLATKELRDADIAKAFEYMKRGMKERFQDPSHPVLKQLMEPVESYQDRKESQTLEELAQIKGDFHAICMEGVYIKERFLGSDNYQFLHLIRSLATCHEHSRNFDNCLRLRRHALEINQQNNHSNLTIDIEHLICLFYNMIVNKFPLRQDVVLEVLQKTGVELAKELDTESVEKWNHLVDHTVGLLQIFANEELFEEGKNPCVLAVLKELVGSYLRNSHGNTLLHLTADGQHRMKIYPLAAKNPSPFSFPCTKTVKLLLNMGFSVNAVNSNGDTPLHRAVTFEPSNNNIHLMTDTLEVLLDRGAHHDFVNNDGKTAMDMARTHEARWILSEIKKLELKCIAARAVKKFGLPYLGMVPKTLEKYLSMH